MRLASLRLVGVPPFRDVTIPFGNEDGTARALTVLYGGGGVGKTTVLHAIACTRPGYAVVLGGQSAPDAFVAAEWLLGADDPDRPHPLGIATPTARFAVDEHEEMLRRRQQAHFDRVAKDGGFVAVTIPSTRWFSRQPLALSAPARTLAKYDVRAPAVLEDASRTDLTRETKQSLAYAAITAALAHDRASSFARLGAAMTRVVDALVTLAGFSYAGIDPASFEPTFRADDGALLPFDALPTRARHLVAFGAIPLRNLWAAYPETEPLELEGVVCIDEVELQQDAVVQAHLLATLREVLPRVQWIVTTTSPIVASSADAHEVHALRRLPRADSVELFSGPEARTH